MEEARKKASATGIHSAKTAPVTKAKIGFW